MNSPSTITKDKQTVKKKIKKPGKYQVVFHNDDVTPMDYVVAILMKIFSHSEQSAYDIMMKVHNDGRAVAGIYIKEIAMTKQKEVEEYNNYYKLHLKTTVEPVAE